jgi:casein kinase II subunit beta
VLCQGQPLLPGSISDVPRSNVVHVFCPQCQELYFPRSTKQANLDGAYFGTTFPHLFLLQYPECIPAKSTVGYVPRIYGFKIHQDSVYYRQR